jgi:hypothetical protein
MIAFIAFVLSIVLANWSLDRYGLIDVGPWLVPAGTFWAGLTFTFRDLVHDRWTWRGAVLAVAFLWAWRQRDLSERVRTGRSAGGSRDHLGTAQS